MKNHTVVAIGVVVLMISGQKLSAAGRPLGSLGLEPQSAQQQAMERLREQQEQLREQQEERTREQEQQREQQQEEERQRQMQQQQIQQQQAEERQRQMQMQQRVQERQPQPENTLGYQPQNVSPENRPYNNAQAEQRPNLGVNHPNTTVVRPAVVTPAIRHAMTYNTRPDGVHINPGYFSTHFGHAHGFHFTNYAGGPCIGNCGFTQFGGEWYFNWNGGWFGIMGPLPGNWGFQTDYLYIDIGDDGNYYLYDAQFPDAAVQLTFVQNIGDDQTGADQDDESAQQQQQ